MLTGKNDMTILRGQAINWTPPARQINQDCYYADDTQGLYIVSDGLGSYRHSEMASQLIVAGISGQLTALALNTVSNPKEALQKAIKQTATELHRLGKQNGLFKNISATLTLLLIRNKQYWVAHAGDSRVYLLRNKQLQQLTDDHSIAFEQYKRGIITKKAVRAHPNQKQLTRCLTAAREFVLCDFFDGTVQTNDRFLLCSDGLTKVLDDDHISQILLSDADSSSQAKQLVDIVRAAHGNDDTTVIVVQFG